MTQTQQPTTDEPTTNHPTYSHHSESHTAHHCCEQFKRCLLTHDAGRLNPTAVKRVQSPSGNGTTIAVAGRLGYAVVLLGWDGDTPGAEP
jgi:hypothetical protein